MGASNNAQSERLKRDEGRAMVDWRRSATLVRREENEKGIFVEGWSKLELKKSRFGVARSTGRKRVEEEEERRGEGGEKQDEDDDDVGSVGVFYSCQSCVRGEGERGYGSERSGEK